LEQELARFRNEWRNEVSNKTDSDYASRQGKNIAVYHDFPRRQRPAAEQTSAPTEIDEDDEFTYEQPENNEDKARYLFNKGILLEQQNRHYEGSFRFNIFFKANHFETKKLNYKKAIKFYRIALQLDSNIEYKIYAPTEPVRGLAKSGEKSTPNPDEVKVDEMDGDESEKPLYDRFLAATLIEDSFCTKNWPQQGKHMSELPVEVLMAILKWVVSDQLDIRSLEMASSVRNQATFKFIDKRKKRSTIFADRSARVFMFAQETRKSGGLLVPEYGAIVDCHCKNTKIGGRCI